MNMQRVDEIMIRVLLMCGWISLLHVTGKLDC